MRVIVPGSGVIGVASAYSGQLRRPMTPDGPPVIATARYPNLWLNAGHGTLGWTMGLDIARYARAA